MYLLAVKKYAWYWELYDHLKSKFVSIYLRKSTPSDCHRKNLFVYICTVIVQMYTNDVQKYAMVTFDDT